MLCYINLLINYYKAEFQYNDYYQWLMVYGFSLCLSLPLPFALCAKSKLGLIHHLLYMRTGSFGLHVLHDPEFQREGSWWQWHWALCMEYVFRYDDDAMTTDHIPPCTQSTLDFFSTFWERNKNLHKGCEKPKTSAKQGLSNSLTRH